MALAYLGDHGPGFISVREIGSVLQIPRRLLAEVLKSLSQANLVGATRGPGGGYRLLHKPEELKLVDIIEVLEGPTRLITCANGGSCDREPICIIKEGMSGIANHIHSILHQYTLADISTPNPLGLVTI
jgi:Rrf2 family nitric oxide-sensitive transcriptional repressor